MEGQSDKIESNFGGVETKTATYLGSQQVDSGSEGGRDAEKQGISERPELKRKLKSRHLQMIAIGMCSHARQTRSPCANSLQVAPSEQVFS